MKNTNKSECPDTPYVRRNILDELCLAAISPTTESAYIPFKGIKAEDRVAFYSRGMTMEAVMKAHWAFGIRCRQRHYRPGYVYLDFDWIPNKTRRPQLFAMLADAHDHKFDVLAIPSPDRISRNPGELNRIISELHAQGIRIALMKDAPKSTKRLSGTPNRKASV